MLKFSFALHLLQTTYWKFAQNLHLFDSEHFELHIYLVGSMKHVECFIMQFEVYLIDCKVVLFLLAFALNDVLMLSEQFVWSSVKV